MDSLQEVCQPYSTVQHYTCYQAKMVNVLLFMDLLHHVLLTPPLLILPLLVASCFFMSGMRAAHQVSYPSWNLILLFDDYNYSQSMIIKSINDHVVSQ